MMNIRPGQRDQEFISSTSQCSQPLYRGVHCNVPGEYIGSHHNVGTWTGGGRYWECHLALEPCEV
jgi:hypothetical protein